MGVNFFRGGGGGGGGGGVVLFKQKININLEYLMTKRVYKQETLPCRNLRIQTGKILVKIWLLLRGVHEKPIYRGDCLKAGGGGGLGGLWI